jgi:chitinase
MALDFPNSPTGGQVYTSAGLSWVWDGAKWVTGTTGFVEPMMVVNFTQALPSGYRGFVRVENNTNAPIAITLPASPVAGQYVTLKDCYGNAGTYPVTIIGGGPSIEGAVSLAISFNYGWVDLMFTGSQWVQT